jgi:hypothetical protein
MAAALIQVCVDPRLNHELIRVQVRQKLERSGIGASDIYVLNDIGGNPGSNLAHTLEQLAGIGIPVVFGAVLHHDDRVAERRGKRVPLEDAAHEMENAFTTARVRARVWTGQIRTQHNHMLWTDEPQPVYTPFTFGPPTIFPATLFPTPYRQHP